MAEGFQTRGWRRARPHWVDSEETDGGWGRGVGRSGLRQEGREASRSCYAMAVTLVELKWAPLPLRQAGSEQHRRRRSRRHGAAASKKAAASRPGVFCTAAAPPPLAQNLHER